MSDSVRPHRRQPTRFLCPWDSPGKNTGVGCHFLLHTFSQTLVIFKNYIAVDVKQYFTVVLIFIFLMINGIEKISRFEFGEGNGNPLQYSYLENPMDGRAW